MRKIRKSGKLKANAIRNQILKILRNPMTVTELKKQLKDVSSFGTLDYHLKLLLKEKLLIKKKLSSLQGQPTIYVIKQKGKKVLEDIMHKEDVAKFYAKWEKNSRLKVLKFLQERERTLEELDNKFPDDDKAFDVWTGNDKTMRGMLGSKFFLTDKGKKFLKELK